MLSNIHTHTAFCDGKNTPEEIVIYALENNYDSIGFSGHGYTDFDLRYCMRDTTGYVNEIHRLKEKYKSEIQIYLGIEEDAFSWCKRADFDYIIGSSHYLQSKEKYLPIDSNYDYFLECLKEFDYNISELSEAYYKRFCEYIRKRKPDIIGHFDLITKFDAIDNNRFLKSSEYNTIAEKYIKEALRSECIFEVNTGVVSRGYRDFPYPAENLLYTIRKNSGKVMISSDCHELKHLSFKFSEMREYLADIGFEYIYTLYNNEFIKDYLK